MDEKKRIVGSSGMAWEEEVVKLVKKISNEIKTSPKFKEKKKQMLDERREYIRREKKRRMSLTSNAGSILNEKSDKQKQRPKTAHTIVTSCEGHTLNENTIPSKSSYQMCSNSAENTGLVHATKSSGTSTDDFASFISDSPLNASNVKHSMSANENQRIATKSSGTSTDDLLPLFHLDTSNNYAKTTSCLDMTDNCK